MNRVGFVSSGVGTGPGSGQKEGERWEDAREPEQRKWKTLPASPVGTKAKAEARAEADSAVNFMLLMLLMLLSSFEVS